MNLYCETSYGSLNKQGEELCGDKVEIIKSGQDTIMVLSDGLGSGVKANILASLTSKIVSTMLSMGAEIRDVIETIASTLPVCSERQVAYSTFTFLRIKPTGEAQIVEFDNPDLVVLRHGKVLELDRKQYTIADKTIRETFVQLKAGDLCIFFSDGVVHAGVGKLLNLGWQYPNVVNYLENAYQRDATAYSMQSLLLSACSNLYMDEPGDDTTVAACRIRIPTNALVMVGPPVNSEEDAAIVDRLTHFDGLKIVCGGTTSNIVAKRAGKELKASIDYITPEVPPIGYIDGVDLVTEGVITLGKTLEYLRAYQQSGQPKADASAALDAKKDGASLLASMLIDKCTGASFIVGRALNPAHQNPNLPLDLGLKLKLVEEIADCLRRLDKEVEIEYH